MSENYKVRLSSISNPSSFVLFNVTPELNENRNVNYKSLDLLHMPGSVFAYANTSSRAFSMVAKLVSRNIEEATKNSERLQLIRSWTLPFFGKDQPFTSAEIENRDRLNRNKKSKDITSNSKNVQSDYSVYKNLLGQPPEVLYLNAYSNFESKSEEFTANLNNISVIISQLSNTYPSDVTYIPTMHGEPFPVIMTIDLQLTEIHSPKEYSNFNLYDYKNGRLPHF